MPTHSESRPFCGRGGEGTTSVEFAVRIQLPSAVGPELKAWPKPEGPAETKGRRNERNVDFLRRDILVEIWNKIQYK
jgi:hypothetical protein